LTDKTSKKFPSPTPTPGSLERPQILSNLNLEPQITSSSFRASFKLLQNGEHPLFSGDRTQQHTTSPRAINEWLPTAKLLQIRIYHLPGPARNTALTSNLQVLAVDLLNPSPASEARKHKLKTLVPGPRSFFMDVKCPGCFTITTVFSHAQTVVVCAGCSQVLCQPTGGKARLTEGCSFRRK